MDALLDKILRHQAQLGKPYLVLVLGTAVFVATLFESLPDMRLLLGVSVAALVVAILYFAFSMIEGARRHLLWIPLYIAYHNIVGFATTNSTQIIQLAALTCVLFPCVVGLVLRLARFIRIRRQFPADADQPLWKALLWPRYGRGFAPGSSAKQAVHTILRVRKGNDAVAKVFEELIPDIAVLDRTPAVNFGRFREVVTNSNLKISERQFDTIFSYEPTRLFNRLIKSQSTDARSPAPEVLKKDDRVICPAHEEWGLGKVLLNGDNRVIWVYFLQGGVKKLKVGSPKLEKVTGKAARHPDLEKFRISKAELGIPQYSGLTDYLEDNSRPALLLSKVYEDTGSLSFFGGRPIAPRGFEWPRSKIRNTETCMQFLAQIDLRNINLTGFEDMPTDGILYFFIDENVFEGMPTSQTVFYHHVGLDTLTPIEQSGKLAMVVGLSDGDEPQRYEYGDQHTFTFFASRLFPKFEVRATRFMDIRGLYGVYRDYMFEIGRDKYDDLNKRIKQRESGTMLEALTQIHGPERAQKGLIETNWRTARIIDPDLSSQEFARADRAPGVSPIAERWPQTWLHVACWLGDRNYFGVGQGSFAKLPDLPLKRKFLEGCRKLALKAEQRGPFTSLTDAERQAIRKWMADAFRKSSEIWHAKGDEAERKVAYQIWSFLKFSVERSLYRATARCLDLEQTDRSLLNDAEKDDYWSTFENLRGDNFDYRHQMFGYGTNVQNAAEQNIDKILLLQLYSDGAMSWMFGDVGAVQYWISREDLRARRFDRVVVTLEGG